MVQLTIPYTGTINKTSSYGYTLFPTYSAEEASSKLNNKFNECVYLGIVKSMQKEALPDKGLFGVGIRRTGSPHNIVATYDYGFVKTRNLRAYFRTNKYLSKEICSKPFGIHAIEFTGTPTKEELREMVKPYYAAWRLLQQLFWDSDYVIIAVFNENEWYIVETTEDSTLGFRFVKSTEFLKAR